MVAFPTPRDRVGQTLAAKYELVRLLGQGGMGAVYEAVNALIGKRVAVKIIISEDVDEVSRQRLMREARAAAAIRHPHVVDVLDVAIDPEVGPFIVMELLDGESLDARVTRGPMPFEEVLAVLGPVAEALACAHTAGVVHRDIKPSNIFLHQDLRGQMTPKLVDFGIAIADGPRFTRTGYAAGTWGYMAPEQMADAKRADMRSDIWALAVVVYECLTGSLPFPGHSQIEFMASVLEGRMKPLDSLAPRTPAAAVDAVHRALRRNPDERPQSVAEFSTRIGFGDSIAFAKTELATAPPAAISAAPPPTQGLRTGGGNPAGANTTRLVSVGAACAAAVIALATVAWRRSAGPSPAVESRGAAVAPAPAAPIRFRFEAAPPAQNELRPVVAGRARIGTNAEDAKNARTMCAAEFGPADCPEEAFDREAPERTFDVDAIRIDTHEVTNGELAEWLAKRSDLRVESGTSGAAWVAGPEGRLAALDSPSTSLAGLSLEGGRGIVRPAFGDKPAVWVTHRAAVRFCADRALRLPSAIEWEWAARGAASRLYPWGNAMFRCNRAIGARAPGAFCAGPAPTPASVTEVLQDRTPEGVVGLAGNVAEWTADSADASTEERGAKPCASEGCFVVKGGDWSSAPWSTRTSAVRRASSDFAADWLGFRCAKSDP